MCMYRATATVHKQWQCIAAIASQRQFWFSCIVPSPTSWAKDPAARAITASNLNMESHNHTIASRPNLQSWTWSLSSPQNKVTCVCPFLRWLHIALGNWCYIFEKRCKVEAETKAYHLKASERKVEKIFNKDQSGKQNMRQMNLPLKNFLVLTSSSSKNYPTYMPNRGQACMVPISKTVHLNCVRIILQLV